MLEANRWGLKNGTSARRVAVGSCVLLAAGILFLGQQSWAQENGFAVQKLDDIFVQQGFVPMSSALLNGSQVLLSSISYERGSQEPDESEQPVPVRLKVLDASHSLPLQPVLQDVLSAALDYERLKNKIFLLDVSRGGRADPVKTKTDPAQFQQANNQDEEQRKVAALLRGATYLTLDAALVRARKHSPDTKSARAAHVASGYNAMVTLGGYGPKIDYKNGRGREISYNGLAAPGSNYPEHERGEKAFVLRQPLLDLNIMAGYKRDLSAEEAAGFNRDMSEDAVTQEVLTAYFDLAQALIGVSIADDYQKRLEGLLNYISSRAESGVVSDVELQRVQAASLGAERVKFDAVSARDVALATLERMIGDVPGQIAFPVRSILTTPKNPEQALPLLVSRSAELKANQKLMDAAFYDQTAAIARFAPKVDLEIGQYDTKNPSGVFGKTQDRRAMLNFTVNLLNGGSDYAYARAQTARREQVEFQYQSVYEKAVQRLRVYYLTLQGVDRQIQTSKREYLTYKTVADDYDRQLAVAPKSITDLLDVNNKYYQAKTNLMNLNIKRLQLAYTINYYLKEF